MFRAPAVAAPADGSGPNLAGRNLKNTALDGAYLVGASIQGANLNGGHLAGARRFELHVVHDHQLDVVDAARFMAMISVTYADALIACFDAKYEYTFWRPITAIRAGDTDGNPGTVGDPAWATGGFGLLVLAACLSLASLFKLGRSFGVWPAVRGLTTKGPYRLVRHPMYLAYVLADMPGQLGQ